MVTIALGCYLWSPYDLICIAKTPKSPKKCKRSDWEKVKATLERCFLIKDFRSFHVPLRVHFCCVVVVESSSSYDKLQTHSELTGVELHISYLVLADYKRICKFSLGMHL